MSRPRYTMDELLAEAAIVYPLPPQDREWLDAPDVGREVLPPYYPDSGLRTPEAIVLILAKSEKSGDPASIAHAQEIAARAKAKSLS